MSTVNHTRGVRALVLLGLGATIAGSLAGCAAPKAVTPGATKPAASTSASSAPAAATAETSTAGASALRFVGPATAKVKEMTPSAVLLGIQTPAPALLLPPGKWDYLFGDPKRNKIIVIEMSADKTGSPTEAGNSKVTGTDYARVAPVSELKVDSDKAIEAASALYRKTYKTDPPGPASMGVVLIKPAKSTALGAKALQWEVYFFPANGDTTKSVRISVDGVTGKAFAAPTAKT